MQSICLITCYMGPLPVYFPYYTASCKKNPDIHFIVINDSIKESYTDENIHFLKLNLDEVNRIASERLNREIRVANSWKINELKPLFGVIFPEYTSAFDYWGWCDLDIIWGNIRHFLTPEVLNSYDVITSKEFWSAGHFTLFRNNEVLNRLFEKNPDVYNLLNNPEYLAFEECCRRWSGKVTPIEEIRAKNLPVSMYDIIKNSEREGLIRAHFKDIIREHPQPINYLYKDGVLTDLNNNEEFMYYHLITIKKIWRFYIPTYKTVPRTLYINAYGIKGISENSVVWMAKRAISCYKGIRKSVKAQSVSGIAKKLFRPLFNSDKRLTSA